MNTPSERLNSHLSPVYDSLFTTQFESYLNALEEQQQMLHLLISTASKDQLGRVSLTQDMRLAQKNILDLSQALSEALKEAYPMVPPSRREVRDYQLVNRMRLCLSQHQQDVAFCTDSSNEALNLSESNKPTDEVNFLPSDNGIDDGLVKVLEEQFRTKDDFVRLYEPSLKDLLNMVHATIDAYASGFDSIEQAKQKPIRMLSLCTGEGRYEAHLLHALKVSGYQVQSVISVDHAHHLASSLFDQLIEAHELVEMGHSRSLKHFDDAQEYLEMRPNDAFDLVVSSNYQVADFNVGKGLTPEIVKYQSLMNTLFDRNPNVRVVNIDFSSLEGRAKGGVFELKR